MQSISNQSKRQLPSAASGQFWRRPFRRAIRALLRRCPFQTPRRAAERLPFSRFAHRVPWLFSGHETIEFEGVRIDLDPGEKQGYFAYFLPEVFRPEVDTLLQLSRGKRVFADVGANAGWYSLALAQRFSDLRVVAFEPEPGIAEVFLANCRQNRGLGERVQLVRQAVADSDGEGFFVAPAPSNSGRGHLSPDPDKGRRVSTVRLDSFFRDQSPPDVVKIDVEGAELRVLRGMSGLLASGRPSAVMVEVHGFLWPEPHAFGLQVVSELSAGGFDVFWMKQGQWRRLPDPATLPPRVHLLGLRGSELHAIPKLRE